MTEQELLIEELEEENAWVPIVAPASAKNWTLTQIRAFFDDDEVPDEVNAPACSGDTSLAPSNDDAVETWFPMTKRLREKGATGRLRVVCFHNAGSEENVYTGPATITSEGKKVRTDNALVSFATVGNAEIFAAQLPGRAKRAGEPCIETAREVAAVLAPVIAHALGSNANGAPYVVVCHSMGTLVAFETLCVLREAGYPMPEHLFLSCFPAPDFDPSTVPWSINKTLDDAAFQEECKKWEVSEVVFQPEMWTAFVTRMRADFTIFDQYRYEHGTDMMPFGFAITAWWATGDKMVGEAQVREWSRFTTGAFEVKMVNGPHLFHYEHEVTLTSTLTHISIIYLTKPTLTIQRPGILAVSRSFGSVTVL